jgi:hypothetical protein
MSVEEGQFWVHDNKYTGYSIWEVVAVLEPSVLQVRPVVMLLLATDKEMSDGYIQVGNTTEIDESMERLPAWTQVLEEDLPLYILGSLP